MEKIKQQRTVFMLYAFFFGLAAVTVLIYRVLRGEQAVVIIESLVMLLMAAFGVFFVYRLVRKTSVIARLPRRIYIVGIGGSMTTDEIVKYLEKNGFQCADPRIAQENFSLNPHAIEDVEIEIIDPGCFFTEKEGLEFLNAAGLEPPTYEHALRFAEQYGKETKGKKPYVIFLHKPWYCSNGGRYFIGVGEHVLDLVDPDLYDLADGFSDLCLLAGVRPRKQPQS